MDTQKKVTVQDFYEKDIISRVLSYKNLTKKIKLPIGEQKHVPVRVMEVSLFHAYKQFLTEHPGTKVSRRNFEMQRPKHIKTQKGWNKTGVCMHVHVNIDHLWKALNNLLSVNKKPTITDNTDLLNKALCNSDKISCIAGLCREHQEFKKLDELSIENLHCSKKCMIDQVDCTAKVDFMLVKQITLLIKQLQACQIRQLSKLRTSQRTILVFVQRKYCPFTGPKNKQQYVLRKVDGILHEDHFTFISNDPTHDVPFVELCNAMIHTYYDERDIKIEIDIEFNDGCARQYKCV